MKNLLVILAIFFIVSSVSAQTYEQLKEKNKKEQVKIAREIRKIDSKILYRNLSPEDVKRLEERKNRLANILFKLDTSYYGFVDKELAQPTNNLPERMGPVEYKQRSRSQAFETLENTIAVMNEKKELKGKLINDKRGLKETAYFYFKRVDIKEAAPRPGILVNPNDEEDIYLPMGEYLCVVECGSFLGKKIVHVDPRRTVTAGKNRETVHFWVVKDLSDY